MALTKSEDGHHVYDDIKDVWFKFDSPEEADSYILHDAGTKEAEVNTSERGTPKYNCFSVAIPLGSGVLPLLSLDLTRRLATITCTTMDGSANGFVLIGKPQGLEASANPQGFPVFPNSDGVDFPTTEPIYVLAQGSVGVTVFVAVFSD